MQFESTKLKGAYKVLPELREDARGFFFRSYCAKAFEAIDHHKPWVQMNHSMTLHRGAVRGMHYQTGQAREIKLVRCIRGRVWDVAVDLRADSPTFLQWEAVELSEENKLMYYIPEGFAHGFQCLTDRCELLYCHSEFYQPQCEAGLRYNDPRLAIAWPLAVVQVSDRDASHPLLNEDFKGIQ